MKILTLNNSSELCGQGLVTLNQEQEQRQKLNTDYYDDYDYYFK